MPRADRRCARRRAVRALRRSAHARSGTLSSSLAPRPGSGPVRSPGRGPSPRRQSPSRTRTDGGQRGVGLGERAIELQRARGQIAGRPRAFVMRQLSGLAAERQVTLGHAQERTSESRFDAGRVLEVLERRTQPSLGLPAVFVSSAQIRVIRRWIDHALTGRSNRHDRQRPLVGHRARDPSLQCKDILQRLFERARPDRVSRCRHESVEGRPAPGRSCGAPSLRGSRRRAARAQSRGAYRPMLARDRPTCARRP